MLWNCKSLSGSLSWKKTPKTQYPQTQNTPSLKPHLTKGGVCVRNHKSCPIILHVIFAIVENIYFALIKYSEMSFKLNAI